MMRVPKLSLKNTGWGNQGDRAMSFPFEEHSVLPSSLVEEGKVYNDSQILSILKQAQSGIPVPDFIILSIARQVRWNGRLAHGSNEGMGARECSVEKDVRRGVFSLTPSQGSPREKW